MQVLIPYRDSGCKFRNRNFEYSKRYWESNGCEVITATGPTTGLFNLAAARNEAVAKSTDDIIVVMDADVIVDIKMINAAIELARSTQRLVYPFDNVRFLAKSPTDRVIQNNANIFSFIGVRVLKEWDLPRPWGCGYVVSRSAWSKVNGQDERFEGYGGEDVAFKVKCDYYLGESQYVTGMAFHLWHPVKREVTKENSELLQTYNRDRLDANNASMEG